MLVQLKSCQFYVFINMSVCLPPPPSPLPFAGCNNIKIGIMLLCQRRGGCILCPLNPTLWSNIGLSLLCHMSQLLCQRRQRSLHSMHQDFEGKHFTISGPSQQQLKSIKQNYRFYLKPAILSYFVVLPRFLAQGLFLPFCSQPGINRHESYGKSFNFIILKA